jgi:hypothetical protein
VRNSESIIQEKGNSLSINSLRVQISQQIGSVLLEKSAEKKAIK